MVINIKLAFAEMLIALCNKKELKPRGRQAAIVRYFKQQGITITQPAVKKWFDGETMPETDKAVVLSRFLNCNVHDLLEGNLKALQDKQHHLKVEQPTKDLYSQWPFSDRITPEQYASLDPEQKETIISRIRTFLDDNAMKSSGRGTQVKATN